jgi:asparagine synthetase B (glutamine-hydrolysing)
MAFVVGTYARSHAVPLQQTDLAALRKALQIGPTDIADFACTPRLQLAWIALDGSVGAPDRHEDGSLALLWGALFREGHDTASNRKLLRDEAGRDAPRLTDIGGDFGYARHDAASDSLCLLTDKLGIRALFVCCTPDRVWFSSSLRVMERLPAVRKVMDLRAVAEITVFGSPLGDRTAYVDVRVLRPGERLRVDATSVRRDFYWRWNTLPAWRGDRADCLAELAARFRTAVRHRSGSDKRVFCLLSGGLDSRMIATALREQGTQVVACNISPPGTQDQYYSGEVARALGCRYAPVLLARGHKPNLYMQLSKAWRAGAIDSDGPVDRPHWVFSGLGGDTACSGMLYDEELLGHFRSGREREGMELFFRRRGYQLIERLYRHEEATRIREALVEGALEQLREFPCEDPARSLNLFEMMNDQRRHLYPHWDNAAAHGLQFHLPFFDSRFLELALAIPVDWTLYHGLYHEWMEQFDPAARSVPWQTYPGQQPCPVPVTQSFPTQWEASDRYELSDREAWTAPLADVLATRPFPEILNRNYLRYVRVRRGLGGDHGYAVAAARKVRDIWVRSDGRFEWR